MIQRKSYTELIQLAQEYPVVTVIGPRQSGKTTLVKSCFPEFHYCNLEHPEIRNLAQTDPKAFFSMYPSPLIIDEIQRVPQLLSYIQVKVDDKKLKGQFILTGSHQLSLRESISQSLAGRTVVLTLLPFSISELKAARIEQNREEYMLKGFMPGIYDGSLNPTKYYRSYLQTYVERDVRQILNVTNLSDFQKFILLLAGRAGQVLNLNSLSNNIGVSSHTLKSWLSVLEASFIVYRLNPYFENFGKRVIKSPKIYFVETGLLTYLLGIETTKQLIRDPLFGNIFENMVVMEAIKTRANMGLDPMIFFYRDNNFNEVDLIYKKANNLIPIEIKSSMTFNKDFIKGINYFNRISPKSTNGYIIYSGDLEFESEDYSVLNFLNTSRVFD